MADFGLVVQHFTAPDHKYLAVVPQHVVALRGRVPQDHGHIAAGVNCLIYTADGKFLSVVEPCEQVEASLKGGGWGLAK